MTCMNRKYSYPGFTKTQWSPPIIPSFRGERFQQTDTAAELGFKAYQATLNEIMVVGKQENSPLLYLKKSLSLTTCVFATFYGTEW